MYVVNLFYLEPSSGKREAKMFSLSLIQLIIFAVESNGYKVLNDPFWRT